MGDLNQVDKLTALEVTKRANAGDAYNIIEALAQTNEMIIDMPILEANDGVLHNTLQRTSQRSGSRRTYNKGITAGSTTTKKVEDRIETLEDYAVTDADLVDDSADKNALLMSEDIGFINGMGETQASDLIYGDFGSDVAQMNGLMTRLNALDNGVNVLNAGGSGSACTSVYVVALGPRLCHLIYPRGHKSVGVIRQDRGRQDWQVGTDSDGNALIMPAYVRFFQAKFGIAVAHPKAVKRICNISSSTSGDTLVEKIIEALWKLPEGTQNVAIYGNVDSMIKIDKSAYGKANAVYTKEDPWGKPITHVRNGRCRVVNAIDNTETALS